MPHLVAQIRKWLIRFGMGVGLVLATVLAVRAYDAWRSPPLSLWHTKVPDELDAAAIDAADWSAWLAAETRVMDEVRDDVTAKLPVTDQIPANRYFAGSPMFADGFTTDWNRSYLLTTADTPRGAVVLLHGLTDSPYSLRHIGAFYASHGFVVVSIRMPGHGTVPAGLTRVRWEDWLAAARLAVRQARLSAGPGLPLHLVGYSNGGALAIKYALDSLDDAALARADQLVLISPMVGITSFARFAGVLGWPAAFPGFAKAAWLDTLPEYNPFKYNSFPVNGARQSSQLVRAVEEQLRERAKAGSLDRFPPVLAFQSALDATVSSDAVAQFFSQLPAGGHELVFYDRNVAALAGPLVRASITDVLARFASSATRGFGLTLVTASSADPSAMEARHTAANQASPVITPLSGYPADMYSLSHVALLFPMDDPLYGRTPRSGESFGVSLGTVAVRGERGALVVSMDTLMRASSNPFFDYQLARIGETLPK